MASKRVITKPAVVISVIVMALSCAALYFFSRLSSGYEVSNGVAFYRWFDNLYWKVKRREVAGADPDRLRTISWSGGKYASDGSSVFFEGATITDADPETFRVLDWRSGFSRDAEHAYWHSRCVSDDPDHFQILGASYSRDGTRVYYSFHVVEGADVETFVVTNATMSRARDKSHQYNLGRRFDDSKSATK